jgi:chromatin segregation and condensation protein Rec8/ScpA/Scc1 (kleisin family)
MASSASASTSVEKPFYLTPPLNILFELHRFQKIHPWDVNISFLLSSFLQEMERSGEVNFRASGVALDSSATIYLLKTKLLLKLEEPPAPPKPPLDSLPPPIFLPLRYELTSTTIQHLLDVLDDVLKGERLLPIKAPKEPLLPLSEIVPTVDMYMIEIEDKMKNLYALIVQLATEGKIVVFSKLTTGLEKLEAIKRFITLLFLAQKGKVSLWQKEDYDEIYITLLEGEPFGKEVARTV